jgi:hypothetical protein
MTLLVWMRIDLCFDLKVLVPRLLQTHRMSGRYERHWTPVHLDVHVGDLAKARKRAIRAGAIEEQIFMNPGH